MVPTFVIKEYLNKRRDDHRWMKKLEHEDLDEALAELYPRPDLHPKLYLHQKVGFLLGVTYPRFAYFYDLGAGKTIIALELLRYWFQCGQVKRAIVFVKTDKAFPTWEAMFKRFEIDVPYITLEGSSEEKWQQLARFDRGIVLVTYPGAAAMVSRLVKRPRRKGDKKERKHRVMVLDHVDRLKYWADAVVFDESTCVAGDSLTSHVAEALTQDVEICYGLAGRPFGRNPLPLFTQMLIIDKGKSLGTSDGLFKEAFFRAEEGPRYSTKYEFRQKKMPELRRLYQHRSLTYRADECVDMPDVQRIVHEVNLPAEANAYYRKCVQQIIAAKKDLKLMKSIFIQMRQLSSGFMGFRQVEGEDDEKKVQIPFDENPKLDALIGLCEDMSEDRSAVIFYDFTHSGQGISEALKKKGLDHVWIWSGTKDYRHELGRFMHDPECRFAVINNRIGAYSLDGLQDKANYLLFFESPVGCLDREQAEGRIIRPGQPHKVILYDMVVRGTMDTKILAFHKEGADLMTALRADPEKLLVAEGT